MMMHAAKMYHIQNLRNQLPQAKQKKDGYLVSYCYVIVNISITMNIKQKYQTK